MKPLVSVVITTKNEEKVLRNLLHTLKNQTYKETEIIIVDNNSIDKTKEIGFNYTKKIFNKGPERSVQRNFGVSKAKGKYVLILDADMELTKNVIESCVKEMGKDKTLGALVIPEKSFGNTFWAKCRAFEREFYVGDESIEAARFFNKKLFKQFNGYDSNITGPEDWDLPLRMKQEGIRIGRINDFILHNEGNFSILKSMKKKYYYGFNAFNYLKKHPEKTLIHGNLIFRPVFFRKWKKLLSKPNLALGMFILKSLEMSAALVGIIKYILFKQKWSIKI